MSRVPRGGDTRARPFLSGDDVPPIDRSPTMEVCRTAPELAVEAAKQVKSRAARSQVTARTAPSDSPAPKGPGRPRKVDSPTRATPPLPPPPPPPPRASPPPCPRVASPCTTAGTTPPAPADPPTQAMAAPSSPPPPVALPQHPPPPLRRYLGRAAHPPGKLDFAKLLSQQALLTWG